MCLRSTRAASRFLPSGITAYLRGVAFTSCSLPPCRPTFSFQIALLDCARRYSLSCLELRPSIPTMAAQSVTGSFAICGFFRLSGGEIIPSATGVNYTHYNLYIQPTHPNAERIPGRIRIYSRTRQLFPDGTIYFCNARFATPANNEGSCTLDSIVGFEAPGDPSSGSYGDSLPSLESPIVNIVGFVASTMMQVELPFGT